MNPEEAEELLKRAVHEDEIECANCGEIVDVSDDHDQFETLRTLKKHAREHHEPEGESP